MEWIQRLPATAEAQVFGLHSNAEISRDKQQTTLLLNTLLSTEGQGGASGQDSGLLRDLADDILGKLSVASNGGASFNIEAVQTQFPLSYAETMNTVVVRLSSLDNKIHILKPILLHK